MPENQKTLKEIISEGLALKSLNLEKLANLTNIPERYIQAILQGDHKKLPPAPYVRSYLIKIAEEMNMESNVLWNAYKAEYPVKTSGLNDRLPNNRFVIRVARRKSIAIAIIAISVVSFGLLQIDDFFGSPDITIVSPINNYVANVALIKINGEINPRDKLIVNEEEILVDSEGRFEKSFTLQPGINTIEFRVKRLLGKETRVLRQVIYQP